MSKHTPGPWTALEWEVAKGGTDWNVWGPKASNHVRDDDLRGDYGSEADARLIAAAPELFDVASSFRVEAKDNGEVWLHIAPRNGGPVGMLLIRAPMVRRAALSLEAARSAAIAKAEGRS